MSSSTDPWARRIPALAALVLVIQTSGHARAPQLGTVSFPTSASGNAQQHFLRGVAALHSFWFEEALEAFQAATRADPNFMMGYWGEAMAYNHPLWAEQDTAAGRRTIAKIAASANVTARERAYLDAVKILYGDGDKLARDTAYAAAMEKIWGAYPDDDEAAAFYALALLGTVRPGDQGFRRQVQAGAIALDLYRRNPNHPGAAHYIIHAFDDPDHAILALPAARHYAEIAPAAHHARHMPAHIFLQLGMWPEAAASNESAWAASNDWVARNNLPIGLRDYHSLHWLTYVYLQQGRYHDAEELVSLKRKQMAGAAEASRYYDQMAAAFVIDTERWTLATELFPMPVAVSGPLPATSGAPAPCGAHGATATAQRMSAMPGMAASSGPAAAAIGAQVRGLAAAATGNAHAVEESVATLKAIKAQLTEEGQSYRAGRVAIRELEVSALARSTRGDHAGAIELMKKATAMEEDMPPPLPLGPPDLIKPSQELSGDILLKAGRPKEAVEQFATSLRRQPNRGRSLLGAARAAAQLGDRAAAVAAYSSLLRIWQRADPDLPEMHEARSFVGPASAQ